MKLVVTNQEQKNSDLEVSMQQTITDAKFWLDKYTKAYKENDAKIGEMQGEFNGRIDAVNFQL